MQEQINNNIKPWYKQFWPWFLIFFPATAVVAGIITIVIAIKTDDGLVSDDYYKEGLAINQDKARQHQAELLGIRADVSLNQGGQIEAKLPGSTASLPFLMLKMSHPGNVDQDIELPLTNTGNAIFVSQATTINPQINWHVSLSPPDNDWKLISRWQPAARPLLELVPSQH